MMNSAATSALYRPMSFILYIDTRISEIGGKGIKRETGSFVNNCERKTMRRRKSLAHLPKQELSVQVTEVNCVQICQQKAQGGASVYNT